MVYNITHVLFDLDGTLINTPEILVNVLRDYAKSHGKVLSKDIELEVPNLVSLVLLIEHFLDSLDLVLNSTDQEQLYHDLLKGVYSSKFTLIPGVERLVKHLHRHGIQMAIATGTSSRLLAASRVQMKPFLDDGLYFSHGVSAYDDPEVVLKKPDPQVYHICVNRFKTPPKSNANVLVVEDSLTGITGAVASGMKTLLINDQKLCSFETIADRITVICNTFDDFKPETLGFPPYET